MTSGPADGDAPKGSERNNATITRGKPFQLGNPGRPKGARHRTTLAVEALLGGEAEALTRQAIELALKGDVTALRLCLDRIAPARKDRDVAFMAPRIDRPEDVPAALAALFDAVAIGDLTPSEGLTLANIVEKVIILDEQQIDHQADDVARREVVARRLVGGFRELADQFLEDQAHLAVGDLGGVQVDARELFSDQEQQLGLGQLVHLHGEVEPLEDVAHFG